MGIQEQSGRTRLNYVPMPNNQMSVDARISSVNGLQSKEQGSSGDEHAPKVRKPYTITKQRERWTEEEHKMFLEALQLYGRAWRRIEEHIGTKTAVQIRSHAQKFFSKVVRESAANSTGDVKPIEIPPPRPKRKPVHPYPRKMGNSSSRGNLSLSELERSTSPILFASEQENGSPTSVLSAVGSDTLGSLFSNLPNSCTSPVTSVAGSNEQETSVEEENRPPSPGQTTAGLETQHQSTMELDLGYEGHVSSKEASSAEAQVPCIKLFGRTVLVTDSHKPPSSSIGNTVPFSKLLPPVGIESQDRCAHMDSGAAAQPLVQGAMHGDFLLGSGKSTWSPWSEGMLPMFYSLPSSYGDPMDPVEAGIIPLPWWALCANLPFTFTYQQNIRSGQVGCQPCANTSSDIEMQKECSWTGSNTYSATEGWHAVSSQSGEPCRDMANDCPALSNQRASSDKYVRGFMPYKRCLVEREVQHSKEVNDDGEGRTIGLCL